MTPQIQTALAATGVVILLSFTISMLVAAMVKVIYLATKHSVGKKKT